MKKMCFCSFVFLLFFIFAVDVKAETIKIELDANGVPYDYNGNGYHYSGDRIEINGSGNEYYFPSSQELKVDVHLRSGKILEGLFEKNVYVYNDRDDDSKSGEIGGGVFYGSVYNYGSDDSNAKITGGYFLGNVINSGIITDGMFKNKVEGSKVVKLYKLTTKNATIKMPGSFNIRSLYVPIGKTVKIGADYTHKGFYWEYSRVTHRIEEDYYTTITMPQIDFEVEAVAYTSGMIKKIEKTKTEGNIDTYTITFGDLSTYEFQIENGLDGKDGITPKFKINNETGDLEISYDGGKAWTSLGKVVGKDGLDGKDGLNGENGLDGNDGTNGENGLDGKDGMTPKFKINNETGNLEVSYDDGKTWTSLGKVVGKDGLDGKDGINGENNYIETKESNTKEYIIFVSLFILLIISNIGWIITLKKAKH